MIATLALLLVPVGATLGAGAGGAPALPLEALAADVSEESGCTLHPTIVIAEDVGPAGFVLGHTPDGEPVYRPGSGVVSGDGSEDDPYVIEGWCMLPLGLEALRWSPIVGELGLPDPPSGIQISGTSAHVVVRDTVIDRDRLTAVLHEEIMPLNLGGAEHPIQWLTGADKMRLTVLNASNVSIVGTQLHEAHRAAIVLEDVRDIRVADNELSGLDANGISATRVEGAVISGNRILDMDDTGITANHTTGLTIEDNVIAQGRSSGLSILHADHVTLRGNDVLENAGPGLDLSRSSLVTITSNRFEGNRQLGASLQLTQGLDFSENEVLQNGGDGAHIFGAEDVVLNGNHVAGHESGLALYDVAGLEATNNHLEDQEAIDIAALQVTEAEIRANTMETGLSFDGPTRAAWETAVVASNTVQGLPLRFIVGGTGHVVDEPVGQIIIGYAEDVTITGLIFEGVPLPIIIDHSTGVEISWNTFRGSNFTAVRIDESAQVTVDRNRFLDGSRALGFDGLHDVRVTGNRIGGTVEGLVAWGGSNLTITGNQVLVDAGGVKLIGSEDSTVANNLIEGASWTGIELARTSGVTILDNIVRGNGEGIDLNFENQGTLVTGNNIEANDAGLRGGDSSPTDARGNWWGCPEGPGAPGCDTVSGDMVDMDPWLTAPNPEAGPR